MIENTGADAAELAAILGWSRTHLRGVLRDLERLCLVTRSPESPGGLRPVSPEVGINQLVARQEADLLAMQRSVARSRIEAAGILADYRSSGEAHRSPSVEILAGEQEMHRGAGQLAGDCRRELLILAGGPVGPFHRAQLAVLLNGALVDDRVRVRLVQAEMAGEDPLAPADQMLDRGVQTRRVPALPTVLSIHDGAAALVCLAADGTGSGALLLRGSGPVAGLRALFERVWAEAAAVAPERMPAGDELTGQQEHLLRLLAGGGTDDAVARQMGLSVRTVRRLVAELMTRLDARSRFQAGARSARLGWVAPALIREPV